MPSLMEIFTGGEDVVEFAPVSEEDVKAAIKTIGEENIIKYLF